MEKSNGRILTTHVGSLPRPRSLLDLMKQKYAGDDVDPRAFDTELRKAVDQMVHQQSQCGLDVITDGEMSKPGHAVYINERLHGFEERPDFPEERYVAEREAFPEYYEDYFKRAMLGGAIAPSHPMVCTGPISYCGHDALEADLARLKSALANEKHVEAFVPAVAPTGVGYNEHYKNQEEYIFAVAEALAEEYRAIVDAGFLLQVDDPFLPDVFLDETLDDDQKDRQAIMYAEAINHSLQGIPAEKVRFHTCYGVNQGPRVYEPDLPDMIDYVLRVNAGAYSFEAANPRHEHEYHMWENIKLPDDKLLLPGVITHSCSVVEHPDYVAERIIRFAELVGRENVIASADCGFSSQAMYKTEVDTRIMWAKFAALVEGAARASKILWGRA